MAAVRAMRGFGRLFMRIAAGLKGRWNDPGTPMVAPDAAAQPGWSEA
jgi:hypothetical protein